MRRSLLLLVLLALTVGACDTNTAPGPLLFGGVEVTATGDATLAVEGGQLIVSGLDGNRSGGFTLPGRPTRVDVDIAPLAVPPGGRFGARVTDDSGLEVASLFTEAGASGLLDFRFNFADLAGLSSAVIRYRLAGRVVFQGELDLSSRRGARLAGSGGSGTGGPGSTHVIRDGGKYIVVADADEQGGRQRDGCSGFLMTPPHPFEIEFPDPICTDWVEIEPVLQTTMPEGQVAVTARGVGRFVVRELAVTGAN